MAGIVLVTKPPFLFPPSNTPNVTMTNVIEDYLNRNYVLYDFKITNWTDISRPTHFEYLTESAGDYYFIGAIIALSSAIFSALYSIVIAKLVNFTIVNCCQFKKKLFQSCDSKIQGFFLQICGHLIFFILRMLGPGHLYDQFSKNFFFYFFYSGCLVAFT